MAKHLVHRDESRDEWDSELKVEITITEYQYDDVTDEVIVEGREIRKNARRFDEQPSWRDLAPVRMAREDAPPEVVEKLKLMGFWPNT